MTKSIEQPLIMKLGDAPAVGQDASVQCNLFKVLMWNHIGRNVNGAHLRELPCTCGRSMVVEYYSDVPGAEDYALKARKFADQVWEEVLKGKSHVRIISRSHGENEHNGR